MRCACTFTGFVLLVTLILACPAHGRAADAPPSATTQPAPALLDVNTADDPEPGPALLPPGPGLRGPRGDEPGRFGDGDAPEGRLFGKRAPRPTYESLPEDVQLRLKDFLRKYFPEHFEELRRLDETAPEAALRRMNRVLPQMLGLMRNEQEDPETFPNRVKDVQLTAQIRALVRQMPRKGDPARVQDTRRELRVLLVQRFDLRQQIHRTEVNRLQQRLAEATERLDRAEKEKEKIIDRELEESLAPPRPEGERPLPPAPPDPPVIGDGPRD